MLESLEEQARRYATRAHAEAGQRRKYTDEPYIVHPAAVAELVRSVSADDALLAAAWLHDTVEDTATTLADIESHFGSRVAQLVGGEVVNNTKVQAANGPFVPITDMGNTKNFTMMSTGAFPYYCDVHALMGMTGAVFVEP